MNNSTSDITETDNLDSWNDGPEPGQESEESKKYAVEAARNRLAERMENFDKAGIPRRATKLIMSGAIKETPAMSAIREFKDSSSTSVVLLGPPGVGKSISAAWFAALAEDHILDGREQDDYERSWGHEPKAMFYSASNIASLSMYGDAMRPLERIPVLVIDDLGTEYSDKGGSFLSRFDSLFNHRYSNDLITIITSNLTVEDFRARYGERIIDRIRETGSFIGLDGKSLR